MSFEEVPSRVHKSREQWGMSISEKTGITLWLPHGHWLTKSPCVVTQIGKSEDLGKIRLLPATEGRKVRISNKSSKTKLYFIKYSTLTGAPRTKMPMASLDVLDEKEGEFIMLRLPWARVQSAAAYAQAPARQSTGGYSIGR